MTSTLALLRLTLTASVAVFALAGCGLAETTAGAAAGATSAAEQAKQAEQQLERVQEQLEAAQAAAADVRARAEADSQ